MESWVLEGDNYSFLRSAPRNFNLRHRDGPNRVEIFDITSIQSSNGAISETTCLCDIFGDDCESPSLSSSPASTSFLKREVDAHLPAEDVNDSSGSYHTATSLEQLSDTSDTFEDSKDSVKCTKDLLVPETRESGSPPTDFSLSNDRSAVASENGSPSPTRLDDGDLSQTENQQESHLPEDDVPIHKDSSAQQLVRSTSEFRDTSSRVTDPSPETDVSETWANTEHSATASCEQQELSHPPKPQESSVLEDTFEPSGRSSPEIHTSEVSAEENGLTSHPGEEEAMICHHDVRGNHSSATDNISHPQETDLNCDQGGPSTSSPLMRPVTPATGDIPPSAHTDTDTHSESDVIPEPKALADSPEAPILESPPLLEDTAGLPEEPSTEPSARLSAEDNGEPNISIVSQHPTVCHETREVVVSPDPRRLSFLSDTASLEVGEFLSSSGSLVAALSSNASIVIHSPMGYTTSPSPEFERKVFSAEPEDLPSTPEIPETDYTVTPSDFRGSFSSPDSKLCVTPTSRTSTPEIRQNLLTPDSVSMASPDLSSATCSPEMGRVACSILCESSQSPQIQGITYKVVSPNKDLEQTGGGVECAEPSTDPINEIRSLANSPTSKLPSTPGSMSRPSSMTFSIPTPSPEIRDQRSPDRFSEDMPVPEPCISPGQADSCHSTSEEVDLPSFVPVDQFDQFGGYKEPFRSSSPEDVASASAALNQVQIIKGSEPEESVAKLSAQVEENGEMMNEGMSELITHENPNSQHLHTAQAKVMPPIGEEKGLSDVNDSCSGTESVERDPAGSEKPLGHPPRESPSVFHSDNDRKYDGQLCRNKGWSEERVIQEGHTSGKGEESIAEGSYRGEQVELSFRDRNRKGPASPSAAPSSGDPKSGIPPRCYFESPLTTRRQQSLLRAQGVQKEDKRSARRVQSAFQSKHSGAGCLPSGCTSETSSMGSEFDEADNEVKWFTDVAFTSLSNPQGDYLDVYSSSYRSSTNVSQPSTVDSPAAATWMSYADLRGSTLHENDELLCHPPSFGPQSGLDPSKRFEMGSFECVDVAVESKEESRRGKRTVPKRQIQLKRRNADEPKSTENTGNVMGSPSTRTCPGDSLLRQHSSPTAGQDDQFEGEPDIQSGQKMLQKSASFEETSTKTKMASCIIKSVLSKKMDTGTKDSSRSDGSSSSDDKTKLPETASTGPSSNIDRHSMSPNRPSECNLSSEDFPGKEERSPCLQKKKSAPKVPPKPFFKASFLPAYNNADVVAFHDEQMPRTTDPFESKTPKKQMIQNGGTVAETAGANNWGMKRSCDSANTIASNTSATATRAASGRVNKGLEDPVALRTHKQKDGRRMFLSKTPEITLKPCTVKDKQKSPLKVPVSPDLSTEEPTLEDTLESQGRFAPEIDIENEEDPETIKPKPVIHKVRDVRKLVKNTYNLSFKASNPEPFVDDAVTPMQEEMPPQIPHPLQIEYKAISWKDKQTSGNKASASQETQTPDISEAPRDSEMGRKENVTVIADMPKIKTESQPKMSVQVSDMDMFTVPNPCNPISTSEHCEHSPNLEVPPRPTSKEVSTVIFMQEAASSAMQKPASPASPDGKTLSSSHSVSMLLKEKGMQADIGVCDVLNEGTGATTKHINRLEVPLQTSASDGTSNESLKECLPCEPKPSINGTLQASQCVSLVRSSPKPNDLRMSPAGTLADIRIESASKEEEKMTTHATSMTKILTPLAPSNKAEVRSFSSGTKTHALPVTTSKEVELPIQVRSMSSDRPKPSVPPKPNYKQPFTEMRSISNDLPKTDIAPTSSILKPQTHLKSDGRRNETSTTTTTHKEQSTEAASSNTTKKLAVSAVSSCKPPAIPVTTASGSVQKSTTTSVATGRQQVSTTSVQNLSNRQQLNMTVSQEQVVSGTSSASSQRVLPVASQGHAYKQPSKTASFKEDFLFRASDDPPSYDERESFSPLLLSDLPPRRLNRYHPANKPSPCSCPTASHPHLGHPYHGSQTRTPPAPVSPGQSLPFPGAPPQAQVRPHQCRQDSQPLNYPPVSPKTTGPQAPPLIQPLHHSYPCPAPVNQAYADEQHAPSAQQLDRHSANHRSPQAAGGAAYREHSRSPNMALDPRSQFFGSHDLPPAFAHDYGSDGPGGGGILYPENASGLGYGQGPRRVLLDPETGKYFYIEVPMQPLRKMLFDPEMGQYVEVLIPQQAMSHSGMYPPTAAPYPSLHGPGLYAPQYLPYAAPPHPQSAQQTRHSETSVSTSLHQTSMAYGSSASQIPKSEAKGHPSLDQSYLESMYYIPTGINASPNPAPTDCYHKPSPSMPTSGGRRA